MMAESIPDAWRDGTTNALAVATALSRHDDQLLVINHVPANVEVRVLDQLAMLNPMQVWNRIEERQRPALPHVVCSVRHAGSNNCSRSNKSLPRPCLFTNTPD